MALEVFAEHGYHATSMNAVAHAAGVTKPVLYQHFRSKQALYGELLDDVSARLEEAITKAIAGATGPRQQVRAGFGSYFDFVTDHPAAFTILFGDTSRGDEFAGATRRVEAAIAEAIAPLIDVEGLATEDRRLLAHGIVGLTEATSRHWVARGHQPPAGDLADRLAELAWAGLRGVRPG